MNKDTNTILKERER